MSSKVTFGASVFKQKVRFITPQMHDDLRTILTKMNSETKYTTNGLIFSSEAPTKLIIKNKASLTDGRTYIGNVSPEKQMKGSTNITLGKTRLTIDNKTGQITHYKKFLFETWSGIIKNLGEVLSVFKENYNNASKVQKHTISIEGLTSKGLEKLYKYI